MSARELTSRLKGRWHSGYGLVCCPAHDDRTPSLSLWDHPDGGLGAKCHAGCDYASIMAALRDLHLIEPEPYGRCLNPVEEARRRAEERADKEKRGAFARRIWDRTLPAPGTPVEAYLRSRDITCDLPTSLRFAPSLRHPLGEYFPAMVALVEGSNGFGVHRTWLRDDGAGKADVSPPKAMLGVVNYGAVRLVGSGGSLVVAEGIETALSLASGLLKRPATIWAALSAPGLEALRLPPKPGRLYIAIDGDPVGREASTGLAKRATRDGWDVFRYEAPEGQDWNDVLQAKAREVAA
jgi:hypothetical protein